MLLSYRRQLGAALGAFYHSSHEQLFELPFLSLGAEGECLLNYNGEGSPVFRTGSRGTFQCTAPANHASGQTLLNWISPLDKTSGKQTYLHMGLSTARLGRQLNSLVAQRRWTCWGRSWLHCQCRRSAQKRLALSSKVPIARQIKRK